MGKRKNKNKRKREKSPIDNRESVIQKSRKVNDKILITTGSPAAAATKSTKNKTREEKQLSLASRLKRQRGTAESTPLPAQWSRGVNVRKKVLLLSEKDKEHFLSCWKECYRGFCWEDPEKLPNWFHTTFDEAFDALFDARLFLHDCVQPGGKKLSKTYVTRTLLGQPGSTYRYLGLRLFSHPWCPVDVETGDPLPDATESNTASTSSSLDSLMSLGYSSQCAEALVSIGRLNATLVDRTQVHLQREIKPHVELVGSADYNLTLINRMQPSSRQKELKMESKYQMGKASVNWHKDSGLQDFSSIAVYHSLRATTDNAPYSSNSTPDSPWKVALRVASPPSSVSAIPALSVPLPSGAAYYLLDDFNHQHEHAVIAGSNLVRYSSTHRVAREGQGTWQYIRNKCQKVLAQAKSELNIATEGTTSSRAQAADFVKQTRVQQQLLTELEFEWLRQWYIQGERHALLHPYWHKPIEIMEKNYEKLEEMTKEVLASLEANGTREGKGKKMGQTHSSSSASPVHEDLYDVMVEALVERQRLRSAWRERTKDSIFKSLAADMRPMPCPKFDRIAVSSTETISELRKWRAAFVSFKVQAGQGSTSKHGKKSISNAQLTKKESRKVASNWEMMKKQMKKKK